VLGVVRTGMAKRSIILPTEHQAQADVVRYLRSHRFHPFLINNELGRSRNFVWANHLKSQGLMPGFPDLGIAEPAPLIEKYTRVWIEMKRGPYMRPTVTQRLVHELLRDQGDIVIVGQGALNTIEQLVPLGY